MMPRCHRAVSRAAGTGLASRGRCAAVRWAIAAMAAAAGTAGCSRGPAAPTGPVDRTVTVAVGESVRVPEGGAWLRFDRVSADSRCPLDALCIQGGDAIVQVTVSGAFEPPAAYELHTGRPGGVRHHDLTLTLDELSPYPFSARPIDPSTYRAAIHIRR